jgi:hypothetical protein
MINHDDWCPTAVEAVEKSITQLFEEFIQHPFTHRREHSLHVDLYHHLLAQQPLSKRYRIGATAFETRLVHKEWPTTTKIALTGKAPTRQSYDIGILSPAALIDISTEDFARGTPPATIAIELGLDYGFHHLDGDLKKFERNDVQYAYIVHLSRVRTKQSVEIERLIEAAESTKVKTAFAHLDVSNHTWVCKNLDGSTFEKHAHGDMRGQD